MSIATRCRSGSSRATPSIPGSRGRNCAKGPATLNQITDPDRILYPLKRSGPRGSGGWTQVSWDEALHDIATRIRAAITGGRPNEVMYHVGRPGEDGFTERILAAWGVDGHNSHTNVCSSSARAGYHFWMGLRPAEPRPRQRKGHPPHQLASRGGPLLQPARAARDGSQDTQGARLIVLDTRLSNTATHADHWLAPYPGSEAAIMLAIANHLIQHDLYDREYRGAMVELAGVSRRGASGGRGDVRELRARTETAVPRVHVRARCA